MSNAWQLTEDPSVNNATGTAETIGEVVQGWARARWDVFAVVHFHGTHMHRAGPT